MFFRFMGNYREQLWFSSPNFCGAFLCMTILGTIGIWLLGARIKHKGWKIIFYLPVTIAILLQMLFLAETYSRGGYVAVFGGLLVAFVICRRFALLGFGAIQFLMIALTANGIDRIKTISDLAEGSIRNRFLAWRGGMGVIADAPWTGVPQPGVAYHAYFQPLWLDEHYATLINDYLHIAGKYGLYVSAAGLGILTFLLLWNARTIIKNGRKNVLGACLIGGCVTFLIAGLFSYILRQPDISYLMLFYVLCSTVPTIFLAFRRRSDGALISLIAGVLAAILPALAIYIQGCREIRAAGYQTLNVQELFKVSPAHIVPAERKAVLIALIDSEPYSPNRKADQFRELIRPLLPLGIEVFLLMPGSGLNDIAPLVEQFKAIQENSPPGVPIWLAGTGTNIRQGILADGAPDAPNFSGILADGTIPVAWPFEELDLSKQKEKLTTPLTVFRIEGQDAWELENLEKIYQENQIPFQIIPSSIPFFPLGDQQAKIILNNLEAANEKNL